MRRTIWLPVAPYSINAYYGRDKRHKLPQAREWEQHVFHALSAEYPQRMLKELREAYIAGKHSWSIRLTAFYPNFYTKSGNISNHTHDITNWEKPLVDLLFSPRYHDAPYPYGAPNLNCDDRFLVSLYSRKRPAKDDGKTWIRIQLALGYNRMLHADKDEPPPEKQHFWKKGTLFVKEGLGAAEGNSSDNDNGNQD